MATTERGLRRVHTVEKSDLLNAEIARLLRERSVATLRWLCEQMRADRKAVAAKYLKVERYLLQEEKAEFLRRLAEPALGKPPAPPHPQGQDDGHAGGDDAPKSDRKPRKSPLGERAGGEQPKDGKRKPAKKGGAKGATRKADPPHDWKLDKARKLAEHLGVALPDGCATDWTVCGAFLKEHEGDAKKPAAAKRKAAPVEAGDDDLDGYEFD